MADYTACSAHGWGDELDSYSIPQMLYRLDGGDCHAFIDDPLGVRNTLSSKVLHGLLATNYWIESLHQAAPNVMSKVKLPVLVQVGCYSIDVHLICARKIQSRVTSVGMAVLSASNPIGLKSRLLQKELLMGEGRALGIPKLHSEGLCIEPFFLVGPITIEQATLLAIEAQQSTFVFTGTREKAKLVFTGLDHTPDGLLSI